MIEKYPKSSTMCTAVDNFFNFHIALYRRAHPSTDWASVYKYVLDNMYRKHRAYVAPSDVRFIYITFDSEEDKTAFILKWL